MNTNNSQPHEGQGSSQSEKFPEIIESERQGWLVSAQAAAVVAALLCGVEASLLSLVKTDPPPTNAAFKFLLIMSYSALVLNASSTIASLVMLDCLGEMPVLVAKASTAQDTQNADSMDAYLGLFGLGSRWRLARRYCIASLFVGSSCIFVQVVTYTWLSEAICVATVISVVCIVGFVPLSLLFVPN